MSPILKTAIVNALGTALYIALISTFMFYGPEFLGEPDTPDSVLLPIMMISLFVFSAAITAGLVIGRPIMWFLEGKKREAVTLFVYTLAIFLVIIIGIVGLVAFVH